MALNYKQQILMNKIVALQIEKKQLATPSEDWNELGFVEDLQMGIITGVEELENDDVVEWHEDTETYQYVNQKAKRIVNGKVVKR